MRNQSQGCIPADHPALAGHFPGNPIAPGVLLLHELLSAIEHRWNLEPGEVAFSAVKFTASLRPGEPFLMTMDRTDGQQIDFIITRGDTTIASGSLRHHGPPVAPVAS
jgi:3-hydroxymyristoyl/3-hydroxydecanoyl-(acyl carrier protein) dehydratase